MGSEGEEQVFRCSAFVREREKTGGAARSVLSVSGKVWSRARRGEGRCQAGARRIVGRWWRVEVDFLVGGEEKREEEEEEESSKRGSEREGLSLPPKLSQKFGALLVRSAPDTHDRSVLLVVINRNMLPGHA